MPCQPKCCEAAAQTRSWMNIVIDYELKDGGPQQVTLPTRGDPSPPQKARNLGHGCILPPSPSTAGVTAIQPQRRSSLHRLCRLGRTQDLPEAPCRYQLGALLDTRHCQLTPLPSSAKEPSVPALPLSRGDIKTTPMHVEALEISITATNLLMAKLETAPRRAQQAGQI